MAPAGRERYVALFDVLGFRDLVARRSLDEIADLMGGLQAEVRKAESLDCHPIQFSDSILLHTDGTSPEELDNILFLSSYLVGTGLRMRIPLRGAVTVGSFLYKDGIFFGPAMVRAYDLEQSQDWAGAIVDPSLVASADAAQRKTLQDLQGVHLDAYPAPIKGGCVGALQCIDWSPFCDSLDDVRQAFVLSSTPSWDVLRKAENTAAFLRHILSTRYGRR